LVGGGSPKHTGRGQTGAGRGFRGKGRQNELILLRAKGRKVARGEKNAGPFERSPWAKKEKKRQLRRLFSEKDSGIRSPEKTSLGGKISTAILKKKVKTKKEVRETFEKRSGKKNSDKEEKDAGDLVVEFLEAKKGIETSNRREEKKKDGLSKRKKRRSDTFGGGGEC